MHRSLRLAILTGLTALLTSGISAGEEPAKKRTPGFFEQLLGRASQGSAENTRTNRRTMNRRAERDMLLGESVPSNRKRVAIVVDDDPEADPGLGTGNLTYMPPKLVPLSGIALTEPRPFEAGAAHIHDQLTAAGPALRLLPAAREALVAQYVARGFQPLWLENGTLGARGASVLALLAAADQEGLDPAAYLPTPLQTFNDRPPTHDAAAMARLDLDLSAAALRYAHDASGGQFDPRKLSRYNDITPRWIEAPEALKVITWSPFAADYLKSLHPTHPAYAAMKNALAKLIATQRDTLAEQPIADGEIIKTGDSDPRVPALRRRLASLGYPSAPGPDADRDVLEPALSEQLRSFQRASGIKATGAVGPKTLAALNAGSVRTDANRLIDNMERLRWLPRNLGPRYVFVNQPAFAAEVIENGRTVWETRVIVGKPNTQTVSFYDEMELVVFNPSWGVPPSIIANEYLPKLRRDPGYLDRIGFKVVNQQGKVVPSRSISWSSYGRKVPYGIHQPPGSDNALGEIKFLFPNSHNIYMHDTPKRELFTEDVRAFSHGCVRVQNPREFASVLLGWSAEDVTEHVTSKKSETVRMKSKIPVYLTYFTAWPDESGNIQYFNDIYGRDRSMETARSATFLARN